MNNETKIVTPENGLWFETEKYYVNKEGLF